MIGRRAAGRGLAASACLRLVGCGAPKPPPPTVIKLSFHASKTINPDATGSPRLTRVRILRLGGTQIFLQGDFFSLDGDPKKTLGDDLVGFDDVLVAPGGHVGYERPCEPAARFVGLVAAYSAIDTVKWRAVQPVQANKTNLYVAQLDADAITFKPGDGA